MPKETEMGFASVEALHACACEFKSSLMALMMLHPESRRSLEKFLCVKIVCGKNSGTRSYERREYKQQKYKQRIMDKNGYITPQWEMYTSPGDQKRTTDDHSQVVANLAAMKKPAGAYADSSPISDEPPDAQALTALLNIIHSINPKLAEITPISGGYPDKTGTPAHSRKVTGKYIRTHTRHSY